MLRRTAIIAAITLNSLAFPFVTEAEQPNARVGYATYRVQIEVTQNGRPICSQDTTVAAGESQEIRVARVSDLPS